MQYMWNNFSSPFFEVNIDVGQGSALSPICYDSMLKVLSKELALVLSDTRELNRVLNTK